MLKPLFIAEGEAVPELCLCVDGLIEGATACYSHWEGAVSPAVLLHDLSTGIVLHAARDADTYLRPFEYVANNHVDADGLLSMAIAMDPSLVEFEPLLLDAAAYGDFNHYRSEAGARLALRLHQALAELQEQSSAWEQEACETLTLRIRDFIHESAEPDAERDAQIVRIQTAIKAIEQGTIQHQDHGRLAVFHCAVEHGHHANDLCSVSVADDLPLWALNAHARADQFLLLAVQGAHGCQYQLLAPTHSWAQTMDLPTVLWPDLNPLCARLQENEQAAAQWTTLPKSRDYDFTCLLTALTTDTDASVAESSHDQDELIALIQDYLG